MFSVPLVLQVTLTGRYPAHCPAEFGLSSLRLASARLAQGRPFVSPGLRGLHGLASQSRGERPAVSEPRRGESNGDHPAHHDGISSVPYPSVSCEIPYCSSFL